MKIAITGANGSIGQSVVDALDSEDVSLICLTRSGAFRDSSNARWIHGDLNTPGLAESLVQDSDVIIHLAHGNAPLTASTDLVQDTQLNLLRSLRLIEAAFGMKKMPHFIYLSSGGAVYDVSACANRTPFKETDKCSPVMSYGIQKYTIERYLHNAVINRVLTATILRVSNAYGALLSVDRMQGLIGTSVSRVLAGEPLRVIGNPENVRDYVHIVDVVRAIICSLNKMNEFEIYNIGSGTGYSVREVIDKISEMSGRDVSIIYRDVAGSSILPSWSVLDVSKARSQLGWEAEISLEQGLAEMFREQG